MKNLNESAAALRFGHVTEYSASRHAARVSFPDSGIISSFLPVLTHNTLTQHDEIPLSPGEHVACLMAGNGAESGVILGAFYDAKNTPPVHEAHTRALTFSDGTKVTYDTESHKLFVEIDADVELNITGKVSREINGDIKEKINGNTKREINGDIEEKHTGDTDSEIVGDILTKHYGESESVPDWRP